MRPDTRQTVQRSLVLEAVRASNDHPTAIDVFETVRGKLLVLQLNRRLQAACMLLAQVLIRLLLYLTPSWHCVRLALDARLIVLVVP